MWYVVQVTTGHEQKACDQIARAVCSTPDLFLDECFVPMRRTLTKKDGSLFYGEEPLLPGYLIVVGKPAQIDRLSRTLAMIPQFARLLGSNEEFTPLSDAEEAWLCAFTSKDHRTIEMSEGFIEGGKVVVTNGPLVGREGQITKINRRKRIATLTVDILGRKVDMKVGLSLMKRLNRKAQDD